MDVPSTVLSTIRLAHSLISARASSSEERRDIYSALAGQQITFTPECGSPIELTLRNSAYEKSERSTILTVSVYDPERPNNFFKLETDFRYHYLNIYMMRATEIGNPLIDRLNFIELGPENYKIEMSVRSSDPPTLQHAFERVETVLAQTHSHFHQFLERQAEQYKDEFEVTQDFKDGSMVWEAESDIDEDELAPSQNELATVFHHKDGRLSFIDVMKASSRAYDFTKYVAQAEASKGDMFVMT